jgi:hypothetical protein
MFLVVHSHHFYVPPLGDVPDVIGFEAIELISGIKHNFSAYLDYLDTQQELFDRANSIIGRSRPSFVTACYQKRSRTTNGVLTIHCFAQVC